MPIFDELRTEYGEWRQVNHRYAASLTQFTMRFCKAFQEHLGAPDIFEDFEGRKQKYVSPMQVERDGDGELVFKQTRGAGDIVLRGPDGFANSAVCVLLESAPNSYPKLPVRISFRYLIVDDKCELYIGQQSEAHKFSVSDTNEWESVFGAMVGLIRNILNRQPWDLPRPRQIGFLAEVQK